MTVPADTAAQAATVREALGLLMSVLRSGEPLTGRVHQVFWDGKAALDELDRQRQDAKRDRTALALTLNDVGDENDHLRAELERVTRDAEAYRVALENAPTLGALAELEGQRDGLLDAVERLNETNDRLRAENRDLNLLIDTDELAAAAGREQRLRDALTFYAQRKHFRHDHSAGDWYVLDKGDVARAVLEEGQQPPGVDRVFGICSTHSQYELPIGSIESGEVARRCPGCVSEASAPVEEGQP